MRWASCHANKIFYFLCFITFIPQLRNPDICKYMFLLISTHTHISHIIISIYLHLTDGQTEAQVGYGTYPSLHSSLMPLALRKSLTEYLKLLFLRLLKLILPSDKHKSFVKLQGVYYRQLLSLPPHFSSFTVTGILRRWLIFCVH